MSHVTVPTEEVEEAVALRVDEILREKGETERSTSTNPRANAMGVSIWGATREIWILQNLDTE